MSKIILAFDTYLNQTPPEVYIGLSVTVDDKKPMVVELTPVQAEVLLEQLIKSIKAIEDISNPNKTAVH